MAPRSTIEGVLTTALGALESGHGGFIQDASGGIALYLDDAVAGELAGGRHDHGRGLAVEPVFAANAAGLGGGYQAGAAGRPSGGDGSGDRSCGRGGRGPARVRHRHRRRIARPADGWPGDHDRRRIRSAPRRHRAGCPWRPDDRVRDGGDGDRPARAARQLRDGHGRLPDPGDARWRARARDAHAHPTPTPTPSTSVLPTPTAPSATPTPTSVPAPTATSTPLPTATPIARRRSRRPAADVTPLNAVRTLPLGTRVRTTGVIVAEPGRLGTPALIAIGDASAGLVVRGVSGPGTLARGTRLEVAGKLAAPYGQLEIRPTEADVHVLGTGALPTPKSLSAAALVEADEGHLVTATGRLDAKPTKSSRRGPHPDAHPRRGCAGQGHGRRHEPAHPRGVQGRRDISDRRVRRPAGHPDRARSTATGSGSATPRTSCSSPPRRDRARPAPRVLPGAPGRSRRMTIAKALRITDRAIAIDAVVTAPATLLDASGRRIVVQDASAAVELLLPTGAAAPSVGTRIHAEGRIGLAYGAPRLRADGIDVVGTASTPSPIVLHGAPSEANEWRLASINGRVSSVHKLGDRWRAEIRVGSVERGRRRPTRVGDRQHGAGRGSSRDRDRHRPPSVPERERSPLRDHAQVAGGRDGRRSGRRRRRFELRWRCRWFRPGRERDRRARDRCRRRGPRRPRHVRRSERPRRRARRRPPRRRLHARRRDRDRPGRSFGPRRSTASP